MDEPALEVAAGTVVAGKYRLERLLKAGGMGAVWVATHLTLDSPVAIKFMAVPVDDDEGTPSKKGHTSDAGSISRARFEREARSAAQLRSANVVQILDYGVDRATAYIVMELLDGEDLHQRLRRRARIPVDQAAKIIVPVLQLLQRAHDAGMVHRDLKPGNIFLARDGDAVVPKVLDFGVAKAGDRPKATGDLTAQATLIGTPHYASPEQLKNSAKIDHRADLWSMGVVLFRMLTGRKPFLEEDLVEAIVEVCSGPIPTATSVAPDLSPEIDAFFARALARNAADRFQSAREMAQALTRLVGVVDAGAWLAPADPGVANDASKSSSATNPSADASRSAESTHRTPSTTGSVADAVRKRRPWSSPALIAFALSVAAVATVLALRRHETPGAALAAPPGPLPSSPTTSSQAPAEVSAPEIPGPAAVAPPAAVGATSAAVPAPRQTTPAGDTARRQRAQSPAGRAPTPPPAGAPSRSKAAVSNEDKEVGY